MPNKSLEKTDYRSIQSAVMNGNHSLLKPAQQRKLERTISAAKIMDRYPNRKHAISILRSKYPGLSMTQAYSDINLAIKIFYSNRSLDYEFWYNWLLNDIVEQIELSKKIGDLEAWCMGNNALTQALGLRPHEKADTNLEQPKQFVIIINTSK